MTCLSVRLEEETKISDICHRDHREFVCLLASGLDVHYTLRRTYGNRAARDAPIARTTISAGSILSHEVLAPLHPLIPLAPSSYTRVSDTTGNNIHIKHGLVDGCQGIGRMSITSEPVEVLNPSVNWAPQCRKCFSNDHPALDMSDLALPRQIRLDSLKRVASDNPPLPPEASD